MARPLPCLTPAASIAPDEQQGGASIHCASNPAEPSPEQGNEAGEKREFEQCTDDRQQRQQRQPLPPTGR
jgi:hypothetical protein